MINSSLIKSSKNSDYSYPSLRMIMKQSIIRYSDYHRENLSSVRDFFVFSNCEDGLEGEYDNPLSCHCEQ